MASPGTDAAFFASPSHVSDQLIRATAFTFGTLASLLGIAAGSVVIFGLIIRAQPDGQEMVKRGATPETREKRYLKSTNKVLVMRASAK